MIEPVLISYRTEKIIARPGILGDILRAMAHRPMLAGFFMGLLGNAIALLRSPGVLQSAPVEAAVLGLAVLLMTTILVSRMGNFFLNLSNIELGVVRAITYDGTLLQWIEGEHVLKAMQEPTLELVTREVPSEVANDPRALAQPWDVWLKFHHEDTRFVIATRLLASEALGLPTATLEDADETLPPHVLAPLLLIARHRAAKDSSLTQSADSQD